MSAIIQPARPPAAAVPPAVEREADLRFLRGLLWLYLALWVFEGALRKWILPGLANPLLVVRDPVLLLIYALALAKGVFPKGAFIVWIAGLGTAAFVVSWVATDTPLMVELYGLRAGYLHLPLIFVFASIFDEDDIKRVGKWTLLVGIPMALLVLLQFRARDSSWLNVAAGGQGTMIESAFGHIRPSGTFSFTNGLTGYTALIAAFFLYHLLEKRVYPRWLWIASGPVLIILIVLSGSRLAVGTLALIVATVLLISLLQPRYASSALKMAGLAAIGFLALGSFAIFKEGMDVFSYRFGNATDVQNGFVERFFESFLSPFAVLKDAKLGGVGLGMGTNVAAGLMYGRRGFLVAEGEPARVLLESGPVIGGAYLLLRAAITVYLGWVSLMCVRRHGRTLPLLIFTGCFNDIIQGQFSQPTELGFATIAGGLCLAAAQPSRKPVPAAPLVEEPAPDPRLLAKRRTVAAAAPAVAPPPAAIPEPAEPASPKGRGRSVFAERLHAPDRSEPRP
jgi:hypothetical protein